MRFINKKALHNYHILEKVEAGVVLLGSEVTAIRAGRVDMNESFVRILNNEAYLINANIPKLTQIGDKTYDPLRSRKLLLHRSQLDSLIGKVSTKGMALMPISLYEKNNHFKIEVALTKSKKEFDRRKIIKERDHQRRVEQELRGKE
jgi:SsrA-binding protein